MEHSRASNDQKGRDKGLNKGNKRVWVTISQNTTAESSSSLVKQALNRVDSIFGSFCWFKHATDAIDSYNYVDWKIVSHVYA